MHYNAFASDLTSEFEEWNRLFPQVTSFCFAKDTSWHLLFCYKFWHNLISKISGNWITSTRLDLPFMTIYSWTKRRTHGGAGYLGKNVSAVMPKAILDITRVPPHYLCSQLAVIQVLQRELPLVCLLLHCLWWPDSLPPESSCWQFPPQSDHCRSCLCQCINIDDEVALPVRDSINQILYPINQQHYIFTSGMILFLTKWQKKR